MKIGKDSSIDNCSGQLAHLLEKHSRGENRVETVVPSLTLHRWDHPTEPTSYMHVPSICLIGQGTKQVMLGEDAYTYDANTFLLSSVELPIVANITSATEKKPYLGLSMELDLKQISQLMVNTNLPRVKESQSQRGISVGNISSELRDAFIRLVELLEKPEDIPILAPMIKREIYYRLLTSEQGHHLRQIASIGTQGNQISRAIDWLKDNFSKPLHIPDLASHSVMSVSSFHHHFRLLTAMTPLQFQKKLRLNEARRLMLIDNLDAASAAFEVGYESPSQFNREYSRYFGNPPIRDIKKLRTA